HHGLRIEGYVCEDSRDPLLSMWALVGLVHIHFGVTTDLVFPNAD
ncbi:MAG: hypothetical protein JWL82_547, partial [Parcubacteria group bacterium]|nr:hypothetical protein [Parcubacteria group bacterium]